jgi:lysozyme family protein
MSDLGLDGTTAGSLLQTLSDVQQRQRRVQQLRGSMQPYQALANMPGQGGGLDPAYQQSQPDNSMAGDIGSYLSGQSPSDTQGQLDPTANAAIPQASGDMGGAAGAGAPGGGGGATGVTSPGELPTAATMRAYLSIIGGPDMKDVIGQIPHVTGTKVGSNGHYITFMSDGSFRDTGQEADYKSKVQAAANGELFQIPMSGAHKGIATPIIMGGASPNVPAGGTQAAAPAGTQAAPPSGFDAVDKMVQGFEGGMAPDGSANFGVDAKANPNVDIKTLTAQSAVPIRRQTWDALDIDNQPANIQAQLYDAGINMGVAKAKDLLQQSNGDPNTFYQLRKAAYYDMAQDPSKTQYLKSWLNRAAISAGQGQQAAAAPAAAPAATATVSGQPAPGQPLFAPTAMQKGYGQKAGALQAEADVAERTAALGAQASGEKVEANELAKLQPALPGMKDSINRYIGQIDQLMNDPNLKNVSSGQLPLTMANEHVLPGAGMLNDYIHRGDPRLATARLMQQVMAGSVLQNVQQWRSSFQRITNKDVGLIEPASNKLGFPLAYNANMAELGRMRKTAVDMINTADKVANMQVKPINVQGSPITPTAPANTPAVTPVNAGGSALPQGWSITENK